MTHPRRDGDPRPGGGPTRPGPRDHGGGIDAARARWGGERGEWLDLSTGINPVPWPGPTEGTAAWPGLSSDAWTALPDRAATERLEAAARAVWRVPPGAAVLAVPGASAAIALLPRLVDPGHATIPGPTYNEHAAAFSAAGWSVAGASPRDPVEDLQAAPASIGPECAAPEESGPGGATRWDRRRAGAIAADGAAGARAAPSVENRERTPPGDTADAFVAVHPNNPDGRWWRSAELPRAQLTVIDESFCDLDPAASLIASVERPGVVILKSFGKFWGLAGLRLGFVIGDPGLVAALAEALGPWPVSGPALAIGSRALADAPWAERTRARLARDARRLDAALARAGAEPAGGTDLFRLVAVPDAAAFRDRLAEARILVRVFPWSDRHIRVGLPPPSAWPRLEAALAGEARMPARGP